MSLRKQTFIQGAMILLAAGLLNRLLGFVPRIVLPRIIGAEGVGLVQLVYPFMIVILTIITGGLPLAVAKMVAEADSRGDTARTKRIVRLAMSLVVSASLAASAACLAMAEWISGAVMTDPRVHTAFLVMIPVLPMVAVSSVWRGYFQGKQNMLPTAFSSTTESIVRIVLTLALTTLLIPLGLEAAAAGAMGGMALGELAGLLVLWAQVRRDSRSSGRDEEKGDNPATAKGYPGSASTRSLSRGMLGIALPVTGSRLIGSLSYLFESILTTKSLVAAGLAVGVATAQYGALQGMVIPLLTLPGALTYSLAVSLVPALSDAAARGDWQGIQKRLHQSMRIAIVSGAPFVALLGLFAQPLCLLLYGDDSMAGMLRWLAPMAVFLYMQAPLQAALQALNRPGTALTNTFIGAVVKLILIVELASRPDWGISGAIAAIAVNMGLVTLLHWISVSRLTGFRLLPIDFLRVMSAVIVTGAIALWIWNTVSLSGSTIRLIASSGAGIMIYLLLLIWMKLIDRFDVERIPIIGRWFR
ncbi:stage V sporulation protein B [Cohnella lubricantis]|uniref:Stage V sporulation protein B n=1 Tax=Cohnella lubricantis TaxID=2163172 RepID=A0A841T808_9BACL|nr:stage V sporulation protein B [Cohnella lubricantis]MBB6677643.1 stage V sporulation protein B [Cohnella lubricantis]MBP2116469.1 stage V sporulation protein B [Cohnella lubricantis]